MVVDNILNKFKFFVLLLFYRSREENSACYDNGSMPTNDFIKFVEKGVTATILTENYDILYIKKISYTLKIFHQTNPMQF